MNRFFMGEVRSRVASTRNDKKRQIKMRGAGDVHAFAIVAYSTKTFKDEPSSPRTFRMSKEEILQRIKQVRSEERRVGKECRSRWSRHHYKKKHQEDRDQRRSDQIAT